MTQGITEFATVPKPVNPCIEDSQSEECEQIRSQSCDALGCPGYPILEPQPEPIECGEGEELVDGQCVSLDTSRSNRYTMTTQSLLVTWMTMATSLK